ncbi:MAG: RES family NAD+ phosphorylase [Dehalococcoidia bacterium]
MLYRVFPLVPDALPDAPGGALYVARERQGSGRHDHPEHYGALYVSRSPESAVAERIQAFRGQIIGDADLRFASGARLALATFDDETLDPLIDLDDPAELVARGLRPSGVATRDRSATRAIALGLYAEGHAGFAWWSTLESGWSNVTLFAERSSSALALHATPEVLSVAHLVLRRAAEAIGVRLAP